MSDVLDRTDYQDWINKSFASEYPRNRAGLILFPRDENYRKALFPFLKLSDHPAKANIYMVQAIVEHVSQPEDTIMDIMTGTGTILTAALIGRQVICIEIEEEYWGIIEQAAKALDRIAPGISEAITIIPGDCAKVLPIPGADHIIFSPPYSNIFKKKKLDKLSAEMIGEGLLTYSSHPDNIGNLNEFLYHQKMEVIYKKTLQSLPPGGTLTIIVKDHIEQGERMHLGQRARDDCVKAGYEFVEWHQWLPPGSAYTSFMRARGDPVIDEENIIILRRPL